jgi:hypothetical protein
VIVVAHHRVGGDIDGEHPGKLLDPINDPGAAMIVAFPAWASSPQRKARRTQRFTT